MLLIQPIPFYDRYVTIHSCNPGKKEVVYFLSEFLMVLMCVRLFFLVRNFLNYCDFLDAFSKKICRSYGFESGVFYTIKCLMVINPEKTVLYIFFGTILFFAYVVRIFEVPYYREIGNPVFDNYFNSIWFTVITLTTIGYGDIYPCTHLGRIVTIILAFWGALLLSLLVVTVSNVFLLDTNQKIALRHVRITR